MSQSLFLNLMTPSRGLGHAVQLVLLALLAMSIVFAVDLIADGRLPGLTPIYLVQVLIVAVPLLLLMRAMSRQLRRLQRKLHAVENRDPLTATYNRTAFERYTTRALPQSGALLMLDVDQLSAINQRLGYEAGDLCLMALAMKFREVTRGTDITGRIDGGTFAIYMPGAPVDIAVTIADRLRDGIQVTTVDGFLHVTASVGAVVADGLTSLDILMRDAAVALQRAKFAGRGRLVSRDLLAVA